MLQSLAGALGGALALPFVADGHPLLRDLIDQTKVGLADAKAATSEFTPAFLDKHQFATLELLAEQLIPRSTEARVAPFLDSLLSVSTSENQRRFLNSLGGFEQFAVQRHQTAWKALTAAQRHALLTEASTAAASDGAVSIRDHFNDMRSWVSGAYYSSEIGMRELGWTGQMVFTRLPGCEHTDGQHD